MFVSFHTMVLGTIVFCISWQHSELQALSSNTTIASETYDIILLNISTTVGTEISLSTSKHPQVNLTSKYAFKYFSRESKYEIYGDIGGKAYLNCELTTNSKPNVVWYKDEKPLSERSYRFFYEMDLEHMYVLNFESLMITDNGSYKCVVGEKNEKKISKSFLLKVEEYRSTENLHITSLVPMHSTINAGENLMITCTASGDEDQPMFFRWDHRRPTNDSANWTNHAGLKYHVVTLKVDKCFGRSVLEVFHANVSKVGEYVCIVFNKNTFVAKSAWVIVQDSSGPITANLSGTEIALITCFSIAIVIVLIVILAILRTKRRRLTRRRSHSYHYEGHNTDSLMPHLRVS